MSLLNMRFALLSIILSALVATIAGNPEPGSLIGGLMMPRMNPISQLELLRNLESTADTCNIEIRKVEKIAGKCIDLGNSNSRGCAAGIYMEPFHADCMND